jgi:hypothetical protein
MGCIIEAAYLISLRVYKLTAELPNGDLGITQSRGRTSDDLNTAAPDHCLPLVSFWIEGGAAGGYDGGGVWAFWVAIAVKPA